MIVLSKGEKINPVPMENMILSHPSVQAAVIVGEYQFSPSLLIDLANDHPRANDTEQPEAMKRILAER